MFGTFRVLWVLAAILSAMSLSATARASDVWTLVQAVGEVSVIAPGTTAVAAKASAALPAGATVKTGVNGRAVLLRGQETIVMSPSSSVTLPSGPDRRVSKLKQSSGTLLFKVGKKPEAHFEVNTPYLAAVVKGTTFTVKVTASGSSVHVLEGAVEVATPNRAHSYLTRAGQISTVFAKAANDIFTTGTTDFSGGSNAELWGTDVSGFELGGESPWTMSGEGRVFNDTGLKSPVWTRDEDAELTARAPERMAEAAKAVNETMGASAARKLSQKPKDGTVKVSGANDDLKGASRDDKKHARAEDKKPPRDAAREPNRKEAERKSGGTIAFAPSSKAANVWTVTQAKGEIKIDGYPFTNFGDGQVRTLPPGTKVETGADSRLGVAHGLAEFVIEANSVAVLGDAADQSQPKVVSGAAVRYREESGRYEAVANLTPSEIAELQATGGLDGAKSQDAAKASIRIVSGDGDGDGRSVSGASTVQLPKVPTLSAPVNQKTEEVRTKVIGGLTLGLYALTATLVLAFGAQWAWRRYRSKAKEPPAETVAQARLRNIKGG
jgi:ferric-dicitrate binding protein FerR (iron transport regulator)